MKVMTLLVTVVPVLCLQPSVLAMPAFFSFQLKFSDEKITVL